MDKLLEWIQRPNFKIIMPEHSIIIVGPFPPPVTGLSTINEKMLNKIESHGINVIKLDTSAGMIEKNLGYMFRRVKSIIIISIFLIRYKSDKKTKIYCSVSGKYGKIFEIIFVSISRIKKMKIYLHYHNFLYINKYQFLANLLIKISGDNCTHITLSKNMGIQLRERYGPIKNITHISNICFIEKNKIAKKHLCKTLKTIGFLSNISFEKGIDVFFELVAELEEKGCNISVSIAGLFHDNNVKKFVLSQISSNRSINYLGPVYGERKNEFFNNIDLLVLPSLNEAEPLVVYEAMRDSVPVIAYGIGCIPEQIEPNTDAGLIIDLEDNFVEVSLHWLQSRMESADLYANSSKAALDRYIYLKRASENDLDNFLATI